MSGQEGRKEKLDMVKYFYIEWEYRHKAYWALFYKTIFAIITIMSLPYFLSQSNSLLSLLWLFPLVGAFLCIFSFILLSGEGARIAAIRERMNTILLSVDEGYKECPLQDSIFIKIQHFNITKLILISYLVLILVFVAQFICILSGWFYCFNHSLIFK